jgi:tetratricopeptide (TPR) repeat protein
MIDNKPDGSGAEARGRRRTWFERGILGVVCALVVGVYAYTARSGYLTAWSLSADSNYYNLLVQGFRAGQLSLKTQAPPGLASLADPYDPGASARYAVLDLSYYRGKLYLYFGVTPAVILFWPYVALTGQYLSQKDAAVIFCFVGFFASVGVLCSLWRRYFATVSVVAVAAGTLALGLATLTPFLLARCEATEVAISCGYALTMLALAAIWKALHESKRRGWWLAAASLAYGLAVGARPSLLFGAVILLVPVAQAWRERQKVCAPLLAATAPITLIGLGLMLYNALRFDSPFEFGVRYQLTGIRLLAQQFFSLRYLWFNFRVYFLEPAGWSGRFPFVHDISLPPLPAGNAGIDKPFGVLTNIPLVWLALGVPLAWRGRSAETRSGLSGFVTALVPFFASCALTLVLFCGAASRYEVDFLPALVLLAVLGILSVERTLSGQPRHRISGRAMRWSWSLLLGFSVAFNLLACVERCAEPHNNLGTILLKVGYASDAIEQFEQALRLNPDFAEAHNNLGLALTRTGQVSEAIRHYERALQIKPDYAEAHFDLAVALVEQGRLQEAISHYEQALYLKPDFAEAHYNLAIALEQAGRIQEAIGHYEQALCVKPDYPDAHNNLGVTLMGQGRLQEAIGHYEQALRIRPDFAGAHYNLGLALARTGQVSEAIGHYERALLINPDFAEAHLDLGLALERIGRIQEAIRHYEQALRIKPDFTQARNALAQLEAGR